MSATMKPGVRDFFSGQSVLVTGATGFLGKAVVEKLLRSCPDVDTVFLLIRPKARHPDINNRLENLLKNPLFDSIREIGNGALLKKVRSIQGDISLPHLGISDDDRSLLISSTSVVIHSAATVRFDEPLLKAVELNVNGTRRVVELCKEMKHLKALVHISTAYAHCDRRVIEERLYPSPVGGEELIKFLNEANNNTSGSIESFEKSVRECRPNTYTYTKALGENILAVEAKDLPLCIVRPSIVTAAWKEPVSGWVEGLNGATGIILAVGMGAMHVLNGDPSKALNIVPVDVVTNLIITAAWEISREERHSFGATVPEPPKIYHCCASSNNLLKLGKLREMLKCVRITSPFSKAIMYPTIIITTNRFVYNLIDIFTQFVPAFTMNMIFTRGSGRIMKLYRKMIQGAEALQHFALNEWHFTTDNVAHLHEIMSAEDRQHFYFNLEDIDWSSYLKVYCPGIRRFVLNEHDSTLPTARDKMRRRHMIHVFIKFSFAMVFGFIIFYFLINFGLQI